MPAADSLPPDLRDLAFRNGFELSHTRWDSDVRELVRRLGCRYQPAAMRRLLRHRPPVAPDLWTALAVAVAAVGAGVWKAQSGPTPAPVPARPSSPRPHRARRQALRQAKPAEPHARSNPHAGAQCPSPSPAP